MRALRFAPTRPDARAGSLGPQIGVMTYRTQTIPYGAPAIGEAAVHQTICCGALVAVAFERVMWGFYDSSDREDVLCPRCTQVLRRNCRSDSGIRVWEAAADRVISLVEWHALLEAERRERECRARALEDAARAAGCCPECWARSGGRKQIRHRLPDYHEGLRARQRERQRERDSAYTALEAEVLAAGCCLECWIRSGGRKRIRHRRPDQHEHRRTLAAARRHRPRHAQGAR